ncbi:WAP four-disulfide core domain protein 3 [Pogoniulus pusillus]|uniref:WAP four-disulfide core domain protein 3 n=1 Tax=Pogoniulus pusillus TaxID=488313 RepID=UPI0030B933E1
MKLLLLPLSPQQCVGPHGDAGTALPCLPQAKQASARQQAVELGVPPEPHSLGTQPCGASPSAESPGYCPRSSSAIGASCGTSCHNDSACHPGEKCCTHGCCAHCVPAEPAKPGLCPRKRAQRGAAACPNRCADDRDCGGDHKCCFSGCGLGCVPPGTVSRRATAKPGVCPAVLRGSLGPCLELCDTDDDCPGHAKCCTTGCGHDCKPPAEVRPGLCPPAAAGGQAAACPLLCLQDSDCPLGHKCCLQDCGRACVPPLRAQPSPGQEGQ